MDDLNERLCQLVVEARNCPSGSLARQQRLYQIYQLVRKSGKLWRDSASYYNDALQEMWEYCFQHLEEYDPTVKRVVTWLDDELKRRLRRYRDRHRRETHRQIAPSLTEEGSICDPVDNLPAKPDVQPVLDIWNNTVDWVHRDSEKRLRKTCFRHRSNVNCQVLFLKRFPEETPWKTIAEELDLDEAETKDIPKWYNRRCLPLLRDFGASQGYIDESDSSTHPKQP
ncbi:MAG: sigma-70 family RNA polymerase sigma factor [Cyanobacteria bacterium SID2]|nr:sigma-70 family RNA polymerase sigma factor [Cyanobacteria bacterium SID2]MBP0003369.1 sigma-70 family RNA polymerase sigma factor [Cyanobacteria bacterium SBC]